MKKRYTALKRKLFCIVIVIVLLGTAFFTWSEADEIMKSITQLKVYGNVIDTVSENEEVAAISWTYDAFNALSTRQRIGFYGVLKSPEGEAIVESCDFLIVEKRLHDGENTDRRIVLLEDDFLNKGTVTYTIYDEEAYGLYSMDNLQNNMSYMSYWNWTNIEITGTCDLNYIYPKKIKINLNGHADEELGYVEYVPSEDKSHLGTVTVAEWLDGYTYMPQGYSYLTPPMAVLNPGEYQTNYSSYTCNYNNRDSVTEWLDKEAKELSEKFYEQACVRASENNRGYCYEMSYSYGLFTSYDYSTSAYTGNYVVDYVFVYHPLLMAMEDLWMFYLIIFIFTLIMLTIISVLINKAYKQQLINETNRQELTRGIAHELKTPLAIAKGYVENWEYLDESSRKQISGTLVDEIDHMNEMVSDLLELSHLEAKSKELQLESVDLYSLTQSVVKRLGSLAEDRELDITITPEINNDDAYVVEADLELMRIVLSNFVSNAIKYADKEISIKFFVDGKKVFFSIENDGTAIPKGKTKMVWDTFYKNDKTNRSKLGSSGLGLAITKNILILHEAEYDCVNVNGKTRFLFEMTKKRNV